MNFRSFNSNENYLVLAYYDFFFLFPISLRVDVCCCSITSYIRSRKSLVITFNIRIYSYIVDMRDLMWWRDLLVGSLAASRWWESRWKWTSEHVNVKVVSKKIIFISFSLRASSFFWLFILQQQMMSRERIIFHFSGTWCIVSCYFLFFLYGSVRERGRRPIILLSYLRALTTQVELVPNFELTTRDTRYLLLLFTHRTYHQDCIFRGCWLDYLYYT